MTATYRAGLFYLAVTSIGWGLNWPAMRVLLRESPPLISRGSAGVAAALVFAAIALLQGQSLRVPRRLIGRLVIASTTNVFVWMGFSTLAMRWLNVGQAALLVYTMPVWAMLLAWPLKGQRPTVPAAIGLGLCVAGLWALFGSSATELSTEQVTGAVLALAAAFIFALGTVANRPLSDIPPITNLAWQLGLGCIPMVILGLVFEHPTLRLSSTSWLLMLYMTIGPMGICYLTWFAALKCLPAATASMATLITPVVGIVSAGAMLAEPLQMRQAVALVLTLGGVALAVRFPSRSSS